MKVKMDQVVEVAQLCDAMNRFPGITTIKSCSGGENAHPLRPDRHPLHIWFAADDLQALKPLLCCLTDSPHWSVTAETDHLTVSFMLNGTDGPDRLAQALDLVAKIEAEQANCLIQVS